MRSVLSQPWAPLSAELAIFRTLLSDGVGRILWPRAEDGTSEMRLFDRVRRVSELRAVLKLERNHQIDVALGGDPRAGGHAGWGETNGVQHMLHLPGLVFRGDDQAVAAASLAKRLALGLAKAEAKRLRKEAEETPAMQDLVLVGGGHAHVHLMRMWGMDPQPGVRVTLVTRDMETPYSGMLPGHVAGLYSRQECHLDLNVLARFAGIRLVHATAVGLDLEHRRVLLGEGRPAIAYDVLSINVGSAPRVQQGVSLAAAQVVPVKPIDSFGARWDAVLAAVPTWRGVRRIVVVGGGAGGFEIALSVHARLTRELAGREPEVEVAVTLLTRRGLLPQHSPGVRALAERALASRGVAVRYGCEVIGCDDGQVRCACGLMVPFDECIWCTQGSPQSWVAESGLETDGHGFLLVDQQLRCRPVRGSTGAGGVIFAAGDVATIAGHDRPKAGVFAVMASMALWHNVRATLNGEKLITYWPQGSFLGLLGLGDGTCISSRGTLAIEGRWLWDLKDWIDRRWMWNYTGGLPEMLDPASDEPIVNTVASAKGPDALSLLQHSTMRCGGCGAKVGATTLSRAMARVDTPSQPSAAAGARVVVGVGDDAAVVELTANGGTGHVVSVQTIDFFRSFIGDPYVFGRIAAIHALSDCEAMGAVPQTALALVQLPYAMEEKTEEELVQLMSGAASALREAGCALVGGHTCEARELGLGLSVNGSMAGGAEEALRKDRLREGDALILTKPIGTGTLFAADMRARARGPWVAAALRSMSSSNGRAASIVRRHGASACTDITGFGLVGHLLEMSRGSEATVAVDLPCVPLLDGAMECLAMGITSSLQPANTRLRRAVANHDAVRAHAAYPLLFDPQTSGGLLAAVPRAHLAACLEELRSSGAAPLAAEVGEVIGQAPAGAAADFGHITVRV